MSIYEVEYLSKRTSHPFIVINTQQQAAKELHQGGEVISSLPSAGPMSNSNSAAAACRYDAPQSRRAAR